MAVLRRKMASVEDVEIAYFRKNAVGIKVAVFRKMAVDIMVAVFREKGGYKGGVEVRKNLHN